MTKVDKSKPLPEIFEALMAAAVATTEEPKAAPKNPEQDKQDCDLPKSNTTMAGDLPEFLKNKHGLNDNGTGKSVVPFDPPYTNKEDPVSGTTTTTTPGSDGTTLETPGSLDDIYKHKLAEAVIPVGLLMKFLGFFPGHEAHVVSQIANSHGVIDPNDPCSKFRHVVVYDTHENLRKYERRS